MIKANENFKHLPESYLFSEVAARLREFSAANPALDVIRMDIGDVTLPLATTVTEAMHKAVDEMAHTESFRGYGPEQGYEFLRQAIADKDYRRRGINIDSSEIFISDGAKSDLGNLADIFSRDIKVAIANPSYPAYVDASVINGLAGTLVNGRWCNLIYLDCKPENGFLPNLPSERPDVIILCYPNNPTGASITVRELREWVDYAQKNGSLIIYDSAYEAYVSTPGVVRSIYEIEGAEKLAIEVRSFSKTAGFTGLRCGYTVVPKALYGVYADGSEVSLRKLWNRRQCTKFNGASYIVQRGAEALYTEEGAKQVENIIDTYMGNARTIATRLKDCGFEVTGGVDSPYIWACRKDIKDSWQLFTVLLEKCGVSCTPGIGFGSLGEGYVRFTGFNTPNKTSEAMQRINKIFNKQ